MKLLKEQEVQGEENDQLSLLSLSPALTLYLSLSLSLSLYLSLWCDGIFVDRDQCSTCRSCKTTYLDTQNSSLREDQLL